MMHTQNERPFAQQITRWYGNRENIRPNREVSREANTNFVISEALLEIFQALQKLTEEKI